MAEAEERSQRWSPSCARPGPRTGASRVTASTPIAGIRDRAGAGAEAAPAPPHPPRYGSGAASPHSIRFAAEQGDNLLLGQGGGRETVADAVSSTASPTRRSEACSTSTVGETRAIHIAIPTANARRRGIGAPESRRRSSNCRVARPARRRPWAAAQAAGATPTQLPERDGLTDRPATSSGASIFCGRRGSNTCCASWSSTSPAPPPPATFTRQVMPATADRRRYRGRSWRCMTASAPFVMPPTGAPQDEGGFLNALRKNLDLEPAETSNFDQPSGAIRG